MKKKDNHTVRRMKLNFFKGRSYILFLFDSHLLSTYCMPTGMRNFQCYVKCFGRVSSSGFCNDLKKKIIVC